MLFIWKQNKNYCDYTLKKLNFHCVKFGARQKCLSIYNEKENIEGYSD